MRMTTVLLLGIVLAACGGGSDGDKPLVLSSQQAAVCAPVRTFDTSGDATHVNPPEKIEYQSNPPTHGKHYPTTVRAGVYDEEVPNEVLVHNLEHGHVFVGYRDLTEAEVKAARDAVITDPAQMLMAPKPGMDPKLALVAWGRLVACDEVPADVGALVRGFVTSYRDEAPESIP